MKKAVLYQKLTDDKVKCLACQHYCRILPGNTGICGVRLNRDGDLYLLVYGQAVAVHIDPMEKKPLYHFLPGSDVLSFGTIGCDFACKFCQNWDISQASKSSRIPACGQKLPPEKIVKLALENNIPAIAYTYNEPAIFFEYAYDTAKLAHKKGIKNIFVSNGYESKEAIDKIKPYLDAINIDLKAFRDDFYLKICQARLKPVLETIKRCYQMGIWVEITTLVIPGKNDSEQELSQIAKFIASVDPGIPWHISRFFPAYKMMHISPTPLETLNLAFNIGKKAHLKYVYLGNVSETKKESTFCPKCESLLIRRSRYVIEVENFKEGNCQNCGENIEGVWYTY